MLCSTADRTIVDGKDVFVHLLREGEVLFVSSKFFLSCSLAGKNKIEKIERMQYFPRSERARATGVKLRKRSPL